MKAKLKIQCTSKSGAIGDYLTDLNNNEITPVFPSMHELANYLESKFEYRLLEDKLTYQITEK